MSDLKVSGEIMCLGELCVLSECPLLGVEQGVEESVVGAVQDAGEETDSGSDCSHQHSASWSLGVRPQLRLPVAGCGECPVQYQFIRT